jgi:hypothetical protein
MPEAKKQRLRWVLSHGTAQMRVNAAMRLVFELSPASAMEIIELVRRDRKLARQRHNRRQSVAVRARKKAERRNR